MTQLIQSDLLLTLAARRVASKEGAKRYDRPIGAIIQPGNPIDAPDEGRPITAERLRSLKRQLALARRSGNTALEKRVEEELVNAVKTLAKDHTAIEIYQMLRAAPAGGSGA